jgi:hypothetical protein
MFCVARNIDYVISAVRRSGGKNQIESVRQHRLYGDSIGQGEEASRHQVILNMDAGMVYYTVTFKNDRYALWDRVVKYSLPGGKYIRTDGNRKEGDNLGKLPSL